MLFKVKNLGVIAEAEVDLSKDLILLTGQNNTGKTYLAYAVYWFLQGGMYGNYIGNRYQDFVNELPLINLDNWLLSDKPYYPKNIDNLIDFFASSYPLFKETRISVTFSETDLKTFKAKKISYGLISNSSKKEVFPPAFHKKENSLFADYEGEIPDTSDFLHNTVIESNFNSFCDELIVRTYCYIMTAQRSAIQLFGKDISIAQNKIWSVLQNLLHKGEIVDRNLLENIRNNTNRYSQPIKRSLEIASDLLENSKKISPYNYLAEELEISILKGKITIANYGDMRYSPNENASLKLEMHLVGTTIQSLSPLIFYLRHLAQKNDCIIIDEPELNLHPDNQILVARFLGRLVNEGFKVIVSTHSNFIIREINNLIMLNKSDEKTTELKEKYGYLPENQNETLKPEQVGAYLFRLNQPFSVIPVTETGFNVATIDETTQRLNECSQDIYFSLFD